MMGPAEYAKLVEEGVRLQIQNEFWSSVQMSPEFSKCMGETARPWTSGEGDQTVIHEDHLSHWAADARRLYLMRLEPHLRAGLRSIGI
jgi:hypothetical protein